MGTGFGVLLVVDVGEGNAGAYNIISMKRQEHGVFLETHPTDIWVFSIVLLARCVCLPLA